MARASITIASTLATAAFCAAAAAQQPRVTNGQVTPQAAPSLQQAFRAAAAGHSDIGWIGYAAPVVDGERRMCCFNAGNTWIDGRTAASDQSCCGQCGLESARDAVSTSSGTTPAQSPGPVKLEGNDHMVVLFRIVKGEVDRVRVFSEDCALDAGGRQLVWLTGVEPSESIALLESLVSADRQPRDRITDGAIAAIALHADAGADAALERLVTPGQPQAIRARVPFWLGNTRGRRGLQLLERLVKEDAAVDVRKKAIFGISQSREPRAVDLLIENARNNADATLRGEAIFWLSQKAGTKASAAITERIDADPDTEVKKRAVFALSQLPKEEAVPRLIQLARTHSNPVVRKQAIFWLGQSKDARAVALFAEILK